MASDHLEVAPADLATPTWVWLSFRRDSALRCPSRCRLRVAQFTAAMWVDSSRLNEQADRAGYRGRNRHRIAL